MHVLPLLTASLPALALAQDGAQNPIIQKAATWLDKAKSYIPSAAPSVDIPNPIDAGASAVAAKNVERINQRNWERKLAPKVEGEEDWVIYVTGGNKSCFGRCEPTNRAWNQSIPLISASSAAATAGTAELHLGIINCEVEGVLCSAWAAAPPALYHFHIPSAAVVDAQRPLRVKELNISTTTPADIHAFVPSAYGGKDEYLEFPAYEGAFHPFDGVLAKSKTLMPIGWAIYGFSVIPSWALMIVVSFMSRQVMNRRMVNTMNKRPDIQAAGVPKPPPSAPAPPKKKR